MSDFDLRPTEIIEVSWISRGTQRLLLAIVVLATAAAALVGSTLLARADTAGPPPVDIQSAATVEATAAATDEGSVADPVVVLPAARLGTPLTGEQIPGATPEITGATALETIPIDWEQLLPGWTISFAGYDEDLLGGTSWQDRQITIWIRPDQTIGQVRYVIAHELGHAFDVTYLDQVDRDRWMTRRGFDADETWWPESGENDYASPAGDLAETIASWIDGTNHWAGTRPAPTDADLVVMRELLVGALD